MLIEMLETRRGSEDGFAIRRYEAGQTYDMADLLARNFIRNKWATEITLDDSLESIRCQIRDERAKRA